jgi:alkylhydroperoxidase family enzyme
VTAYQLCFAALLPVGVSLGESPLRTPSDVDHHFDQRTLAALVMGIAAINAWNRICVVSRTAAGSHRA